MEGSDHLDLNMISYEWLEKTSNPKLLKKALQLLKDDGNYFPELSKAIDDKLQLVDEKYKKKKQNENISEEDIQKCKEELLQFEAQSKQNDKIINQKTSGNNSNDLIMLLHQKEAENEKIKGNELMKTKEFDEAIRYYTKSINMYEHEPTTYCNRALAYIKIKQFTNALNDCNKAIELKKNYIKAFYRRSICFENLQQFNEGFEDLLYVFNDNPQSKDIKDEIQKFQTKWKSTIGKENFEKIEKYIQQKILLASEGRYILENTKIKEKPKSVENNVVKINIKEETIEGPKKINQSEKSINETVNNKREGFKKIQIVEED